MPTAVSLVIIGTYTGADNRFFSSAIFYSHLASTVTIPLWLLIFNSIFGG
jgi:predicted permease